MLRGSLDDFTLPDIFRLMSFAKKTGRLDVVRSAGEGKVYFRDGEVYFAESSISKEPLGQKLVRSRAVTEGQLMKALDEHKASGERLGTVLLRTGVVTEEQLEGAVRQQIEDAIFDLLRWELGEFDWDPGSELDVEIRIAVSVENLIMEASRRLDEFEVIKRKIPSEETILGMAATPPEGAVEINITPDEWRILVLVDGSRSVAEIGRSVGLDSFAAMRVLYGLVSAGLIEVVDGSVPPVAEDEIVEEPEAIEEPETEPDVVEEPVAEAETTEEEFTDEDDAVAELVAELAEVDEPVDVVGEAASEIEPDASPDFSEGLDGETDSDLEPVAAGDAAVETDEAEMEDAETTPASVLADPLGDMAFEGEMTAEELEQFGITVPSATPGDEWSDASPVSEFDAPGPDDLVTETPSADPFMADLFGEVAASSEDASAESAAPEAPAPPEMPEEMPVSSTPSGEAPVVDRAAVVRELAGLFSDEGDRPRARPSAPRPAKTGTTATGKEKAGDPDDDRKRVEDDDQITKGIISRLIDGVKGL